MIDEQTQINEQMFTYVNKRTKSLFMFMLNEQIIVFVLVRLINKRKHINEILAERFINYSFNFRLI